MPSPIVNAVQEFVIVCENMLSDDFRSEQLTRAEVALIKMCLELLAEKFNGVRQTLQEGQETSH